MAGNKVEGLALLEAKVVKEGAVVELIRRRYSQNRIYVSNILAARARFFIYTAVSCFLTSRTLQNENYVTYRFAIKLRFLSSNMLLSVQLQTMRKI